MDWIKEWDTELLLAINGAGSPFIDPVMILLSNKWIWIPLYALLLYKLYLLHQADFWIPVCTLLILITFTDQITSSLMKPFFERLRPCREPALDELVVAINGCGGKYGFASGHAANTMGLAFFVWLHIREKWIGIIAISWSCAVGYSRIYLGVHYPGDVVTGFLIGMVLAWGCHALMNRIFRNKLSTSAH